jgi:tetratricopeptide (TPR) repeat protein
MLKLFLQAALGDLRPRLEAQHFALQLHNYDEALRLLKWQIEDYLYPWGHWSLLKELYEQILPHVNQSERPRCLGQIGIVYREQGNWDLAEQYFRQSLQMCEELGDRSGMASSWGLLGDIERKRGNWDAAERLYHQKLEMCEALGDRQGKANALMSLSTVYNQTGRVREGFVTSMQANQILQELELPLAAMPYPKWVKQLAIAPSRSHRRTRPYP